MVDVVPWWQILFRVFQYVASSDFVKRMSHVFNNQIGLALGASVDISLALCLNSHCTGSIPFILRSHLSYSQIGIFALSGYPYSLKLIWSPIVDSIFFRRIGRRKSWIVPMQLIIGSLMLWIAQNSEELLDSVSVV